MLSSNVTSTSSPGCFPSALSNVLLSGRNWVPSPHGMKAVWKGTPSIVPFTFTDLVEPKYATESAHLTIAVPLASWWISAWNVYWIFMTSLP
jgi:hypothetical protein